MIVRLTIVCFVLFCSNLLIGQNEFIVIDSIQISGNKRTKNKILLREIGFTIGDSILISNKVESINKIQKRLLDTGLFNEVKVDVQDEKGTNLMIHVIENWYIYPKPFFLLADRNFNVWWNEQNRDLKRVNYGARLSHINFTGNRDPLKLFLQWGYTRSVEAQYSLPYLNKNQTFGSAAFIFYSEKKETGYITINNKTVFGSNENEEVILKRFRTGLRFNFRPKLFGYHAANIEFHHNRGSDYLTQELNPDYFGDGKKGIRFFMIDYDLKFDKRVFQLYPEKGYFFEFNIKKEGLAIFKDFNNLSTFIEFQHYQPITNKLTSAIRFKAKANLIRNKVSFANNTGLGYWDDAIRGYELYVQDGTDFLLWKSSLRYQLFKRTFDLEKWMPLYQFKKMSVQISLAANFDAGFVNEPTYKATNTFNNIVLTGGGPGVDIILFNNFLINLEYSFNHIAESGFYFRTRSSF